MNLLKKPVLKTLRHSLPVRVFHWTFALSFLLCLYTGLYISRPGIVPMKNMRQARLAHFAGQFALTGSMFWRIWHGLRTGKLRDLVPCKRDLAELPSYVGFELFLHSKKEQFPKYNPLQKVLFTSWFPLTTCLAATGFTLYAPRMLGRVETALGGLNRVRRLHYLCMLAFTVTVMGHIYLALTSGVNRLKSIFTGYMPLGKKK